MKKLVLNIVMLLAAVSGYAQVTVQEPEFINSYCILTSESTYDVLPKENGDIQKHQNKVSKFAKIAGAASRIGGAAGMLGVATAGSVSGIMTGVRVMGTASSVGSVASAADVLAGVEGMDIVFDGGNSSYQVKTSGDIRLLIKGENNEADPMEMYRIVRFQKSKKDRRIQWTQFEPALLGSEKAQKAGYVAFEGHKYGEQSYLLTIPASEVKSGEYGIFYMSIISASVIPVGTFSVSKVSFNSITTMTILFYLFMAILGKATLTGWAHDTDTYRRDR